MRLTLALLMLLVLAGCEEAVRGPRVVTYSEDRFYIRHLPWRDSRSDVALLANSVCETSGRLAALEASDQWAPADLRYATFRCVPIVPPPEESAPPGAGGASLPGA